MKYRATSHSTEIYFIFSVVRLRFSCGVSSLFKFRKGKTGKKFVVGKCYLRTWGLVGYSRV
jgi:hypothetical protein